MAASWSPVIDAIWAVVKPATAAVDNFDRSRVSIAASWLVKSAPTWVEVSAPAWLVVSSGICNAVSARIWLVDIPAITAVERFARSSASSWAI